MMKTALFLPLLVAACGKSSGGDRGTGIAIDVPGVNALVPAGLKGKLEFAQQDVVTELGRTRRTYTLAVPKGWTRGDMKMFGTFDAPRELSYHTSFKVDMSCGGSCEPKDWAKVTDDYVRPMIGGHVIKDVKDKTHRLVVAETTMGGIDFTFVVYAWWQDGASESWFCEAELDGELTAAAPAFEKACQSVKVIVDGK